jgi:WD40 repeat protein
MSRSRFRPKKAESIYFGVVSDINAHFSPDSKTLVVYAFSRLNLYDLQTRQTTTVSVKTNMKLHGAAFTPDGAYFLVVGNDREVHVLETATWKEVRTYTWPIGKLRSVVISPDGLTAAVGGATSKIMVWDLDL